MSLKQFIQGIRFNFINFFAFWVFNCCVTISVFITIYDPTGKNVHLAAIQSNNNNITLLLIGFFFGSSSTNKKKDDVLHTVIASSSKKDETIKTLTDEAKDKS